MHLDFGRLSWWVYSKLTHEESEIHHGNVFIAGHKFSTIAKGGGTAQILVQTPDHSIHLLSLTMRIEASFVTADLYKNTEASAGSGIDSIENADQTSERTADSTITVGPSVSSKGTNIEPALIPGSRKVGAKGGLEASEIILEASSNYLMEFTNEGTAAVDYGRLVMEISEGT